jgi:hypothetical protein
LLFTHMVCLLYVCTTAAAGVAAAAEDAAPSSPPDNKTSLILQLGCLWGKLSTRVESRRVQRYGRSRTKGGRAGLFGGMRCADVLVIEVSRRP